MSASFPAEEALLEAVLKRPSAERNSYLKRVCGGDHELRRRVEERVLARDNPPSPSQAPASDVDETVHVETEERTHTDIDRYKLLNEIGSGGFGRVWQAEQAGPIPRRVALKVVKLGMDTRDVIAQFEVERQLLALMDHPCIAKVYDAGTTREGLPYFVMELVSGVPITRFCSEHRLPTADRLRLFIDVCKALQHAHQKGVSHRDIKPSNILVCKSDGRPLPKVIDFGIARATRPVPNGVEPVPPSEQLIGTPAYMSPEQAAGNIDIDTRCDVYALGVLLYELLTGRTPFDAKKLNAASEAEIRRVIREVVPPLPSEVLASMPAEEATSLASLQQSTTHALSAALREDLDWIVMKALQKDRNLRYETANGLAMDVERSLINEPVMARPHHNSYRLRKLVRRNRLVYTTGTLVAVALMVGIGISARQTWRVTQMEREQLRLRFLAEQSEQKAQVEKEAARMSLAKAQIALADAAYHDQDGSAMQAALQSVPQELRDSNWRYLMGKSDTSSASIQVAGGATVERVLPHPLQAGVFIIISADHWVSVTTLDGKAAVPAFQLGFEDRSAPDFCVTVSPDGERLAAAKVGSDEIIVHSLKDGTIIARWKSDGADELHYSPDGRRILEISRAGPSHMRLAQTGEVLWSAEGAESYLHAVFDATGRQLICSKTGSGQRLQIINAFSGEVLRELDAPRTRVTALAISPDGRQGLTGDQRGFVRSVDLKSGRTRHEFRSDDRAVVSLAYLPDGKRFVTLADLSGGRQSVQVWDNASGVFLQPLLGAGSNGGRELCVHPLSGEILATGAVAKAWRLRRQGEDVRLVAREFANTSFWGDDGWLFAHGKSSGFDLIDLRAENASDHPLWQSADKNTRFVTTSANTEVAAVASTSKTSSSIQILRRDNDRVVELRRFTAPGGLAFMQFHPAGEKLLIRAASAFYVLDTSSGRSVTLPWDKSFTVRDAVWIGSSTRIIALLTAKADRGMPGSEDRLLLYDTTSGECLLTMTNGSVVNAIASSPDGTLLAEGGADRMVRLRETQTLQVTHEMRVHDSPVVALAFHPTRSILATASDDLTIKLWSHVDGTLIQELSGPIGPPRQITFSSGGKRLACLSGDRSLRIWDLEATLSARQSE